MTPNDESTRRLGARTPGLPQATGPSLDDTTTFPRVSAGAAVVPQVNAPAELAGMLLPGEHVTFASSPHPIVLLWPLVEIVLILALLVTALNWHLLIVSRGHHVLVPLLAGPARTTALIFAGLLELRALIGLGRRAIHFLGFRVVSTNRRIFVVDGLFGRRVRPLGNTALAGSTLAQGVLGRALDYGTLVLRQPELGFEAIRDMRDPIRLYREFQAVANGVDGDTWTPAIRQTQIP